MELFRRRPLFLLCCLCMLMCAAGAFLPAAGRWAACGAALLCAVSIGLWTLRKRNLRASLLTAAAGALAILTLLHAALYFHGAEAHMLASLDGRTVTATGTVTDRRSSGGYLTSYTVRLTAVDGRETDTLALLTCHYVSDLQPGHTVEMEVTVLPLSEAAGESYDATALLGDGYRVGLRSDSEGTVTVLSEESGDPLVRAGKLRRGLAAKLNALTGDGAVGLPSALLLGDKSALSDAARRDFARAGVSHLLAISGFHMTLLFGLAEGLLRLLGAHKRLRAVLLGTAASGYLLLLGFPPSATRAAVMLGCVYLASLLRSRADPLTSLGLAGAVILTVTPYAVADAGFWMSFLATLGLITVMPVVNGLLLAAKGLTVTQRLRRALVKTAAALAVGVVAMSFTLFIVAAVMGEMGILSPLSTLLMTPLCGAILILSLIALPLGGTSVGLLAGRLCGSISGWMADLAAWLGEPSWTVVSLRHPAVIPVAALMVAAMLLLLAARLPRRRRWVVILPMLVGWCAIGGVLAADSLLTEDQMSVTYLQPSSQADMLVLTRGRDAVICDLGNGSLTSMTAAAREAEAQGATEVAALMLTHYHSRTAGALHAILEREKVRRLWLPVPADEKDYYLMMACLEQAEEAGVTAILYGAGEELTVFGACGLTLETASVKRSVQPVLLLSLDAGGGGRLVYCGSAIFESPLAEAAADAVSRADTVIFGNHGPLPKAPFGEGLTLRTDTAVILSAYGDVAGYFYADGLDERPLHLGQWRGVISLRKSK